MYLRGVLRIFCLKGKVSFQSKPIHIGKKVLSFIVFIYRLLDQIETLNRNAKKDQESRHGLEAAFQKTIDRLEEEVKNQKALTHETNEKLSAHDVAAKRAIMVLQKEMGAKVEQVTTYYFVLKVCISFRN